jgi:hypothetical protein
VVDELGASTHQAVAGAEAGEIDLGDFAAVTDGGEEFGIEPSESGEGFGIDPVVLGVIGVDEPHPPGVGDQDLMLPLLEQATDPG